MRRHKTRAGSVAAALVVVAGLPMVAQAGVGAWTSGGPFGGQVNAIAVDPSTPSTLYAGAGDNFSGSGGGVFKSVDGGRTWAASSTYIGLVTALAIDRSSPSTLYAGAGNGIYKSTDAGWSWENTSRGLFLSVTALAIDPANPATLYAGTGSGVYKSTDAGKTWAAGAAAPKNEVYALTINPAVPSTLYSGTYGGGVFKSTDGGATWTAVNAGLTNQYVYALAIDPANPATLYAGHYYGGICKSVDAGATWTPVNTGLTNLTNVLALAVDPTTPSTLYAGIGDHITGFNGGVLKSTDSGATWVAAGTRLADKIVYALAIQPAAATTLFAGTHDGIFVSTDAGGAWATASTGLANPYIWALAVEPRNPATLYAGVWGGVYKSTDSGRSWTLPDTRTFDYRYPQALAIDPAAPSTLYAGTYAAGVFKSTDGGASWAAATQGLPLGTTVNGLAVDPATPSTLYAATTAGIYKSTDGGGTWNACTLPVSTNGFAVAVDPATPTTVYVGTLHGVFKSTDAGGKWFFSLGGLTYLPVASVAIDPVTPSTLYASTSTDGIFRSTDSGATWNAVGAGLPGVARVALDPSAPSHLYVGTFEDGVFESTDSGTTWSPVYVGLPWASPGGPSVTALTAAPDHTLYAGFLGVWQRTPSGTVSFPVTLPIVLSSTGMGGSFFTSEVALTNRGTTDVSLTYRYTSAFGGADGTATETLAAGTQKILPDAIEHLRGLHVPVGDFGNRGGTLRLDFSGPAAAMVRTTTAVPNGRAGLAYAGLPPAELLWAPVILCGLRQNTFDRSNVAVLNAGGASDGPIALRLTVVSGDPAHPATVALPDVTLAAGGFSQVSGVLASNGLSLTNGYVKVERVAGTAPFYAYGIINDQANSDGSFVAPVPASVPAKVPLLTLPVVVETDAFSSELVLTNFGETARSLVFYYFASFLTGGMVTFEISLLPYEQQVLPSIVQLLRDRGIVHDARGPAFSGPLLVADSSGDLRDVSVAARTSTPGGGGRYGLFYAAVPAGSEAITEAWLYGLQQNEENRTNLALVNVGSADGSADTLRIDLFDGATGLKAGTTEIAVPAKGFVQVNAILAQVAPSVTGGYARVTRTSGNNPFIAYAVINDGGQPGERSGDGAFIAADRQTAP